MKGAPALTGKTVGSSRSGVFQNDSTDGRIFVASTTDSITSEAESIVALKEHDSWASSILFTYIR
jgi:hypothetical protein